jgi:hypothetical protein
MTTWKTTVCLVAALCIHGCASGGEKKETIRVKKVAAKPAPPAKLPIVAVFAMQSHGGAHLAPATLEGLTDQLTVALVESGVVEVIPGFKVKQQVTQRLRAGNRCEDEACYFEVGKALGAQKIIATKVGTVGRSCGVTGTLYDLSRSATEAGAHEVGPCRVEALSALVKRVAARLTGGPVVAAPWGDAPAGGGGTAQPKTIRLDCPDCDFDENRDTDRERRRDARRLRRDAAESKARREAKDRKWKRDSLERKERILGE